MTAAPLRRRLFGALSLQSVAIVVIVLQELALVPICLWGWGTAVYRDWLVVLAAAEFLSLLDLGLMTYFSNLLMARAAGGDEAGYRRLKGFILSAYLSLMAGGFTLLALLALLVSPAAFGEALGAAPDSLALFLPLGLWVVIRLPTGLFTGVYRARGEPARGILFDLLFTLGRIVAISAAILLGGGPPAAAASLCGLAVLTGAAAARDQRRRYGERWPAPRIPEPAELREALTTGLLYNLNGLALLANVQGMVLVIAQFAGDTLSVVLFTTARTVTGVARQVAIQLAMVVGVEQSRERGAERHHNLLRLHRFALRLGGTVTGALGGLILVVGSDLLTLWTRGKVPYEGALFLALLAAAMAGAPTRAAAQLYFYTNRPRALAATHAAAAAIALPMALLLVPQWGAIGAAVALLAAELSAVSGWLGRVLARDLGERWWRQWSAGALPSAAAFALSGAIAWPLHQAFGGPQWWRLIAVGGAWAILLAPPALALLLPGEQTRE
ncbi:MATE family efflux transporter [Endothiovibrio diazotrophicus]